MLPPPATRLFPYTTLFRSLVLGLLAKRLPKHQQAKALTYGLVGAFVFRFLAIFTASFLLRWTFVKFLGGAYLVYIAVDRKSTRLNSSHGYISYAVFCLKQK